METPENPSPRPPPSRFFRNLLTTLSLLAVCIVAGLWAQKNGRLQSRPPSTPSAIATEPPIEIEATPTPLPPHFPDTESDLSREFHGEKSLDEAFAACWPNHPIPDSVVLDGTALTEANLAKLFGPVERHESLDSGRIGLLFSASENAPGFAPRAVGSAVKAESSDGFQHFQVRAAGRMLQCETRDTRVLCECI